MGDVETKDILTAIMQLLEDLVALELAKTGIIGQASVESLQRRVKHRWNFRMGVEIEADND